MSGPTAEHQRFVCWLEDDEDESDGQEYEERPWRDTVCDAAESHADWMAENGGYPDHQDGNRFSVSVRDRKTGKLYRTEVEYEYDPRAVVRGCIEVASDEEVKP